MRLFGRNDDGATGDDVVWQNCPGCIDPNLPENSLGYITVVKTNRKGESVETDQRCGGCRGTGQVPGGSRS